jgi:hypothetical protein
MVSGSARSGVACDMSRTSTDAIDRHDERPSMIRHGERFAPVHLARAGLGLVAAVLLGAGIGAVDFAGDRVLGSHMRGQLAAEAERFEQIGAHRQYLRPAEDAGSDARVWRGGVPGERGDAAAPATGLGDAFTRLDRHGRPVHYVVTGFETLGLGEKGEVLIAVAQPIGDRDAPPLRIVVDPPLASTAPRRSVPARAL